MDSHRIDLLNFVVFALTSENEAECSFFNMSTNDNVP